MQYEFSFFQEYIYMYVSILNNNIIVKKFNCVYPSRKKVKISYIRRTNYMDILYVHIYPYVHMSIIINVLSFGIC